MRRYMAALLALALWACGQPGPSAPHSSPRGVGLIGEAAFEACRPEVARLIHGRVNDWRQAMPECRIAYAMVSIAAAHGAPAQDPSSARLFVSCMSELTRDSPSYEHLADPSRHCALAV